VRRSLLVLVLFAAAVMASPTPGHAIGVDCEVSCVTSGSVGAYDGGLFTSLGIRDSPSQVPSGRVDIEATGPLVQYNYAPVCDGVCHSPTAQKLSHSIGCQGSETAVWVATRTVAPGSSWTLQGPPECLTAAQELPFDPAQLQATVDDYFQKIPLPAPSLRIAPADNAVVNLPEIVSVNAPAQTTFTVDVAPFPTVTISANVSWEWDFGDGASLATTSPGRPYDVSDPNATDYISHTYRTASDGRPLTVTSVWTATYTVQGMPGPLAVTGAVRRSTTRILPAAEYSSILTGN
jgi:hypothetical protein